jgi:uncharacterized protein (UPF0335 family)
MHQIVRGKNLLQLLQQVSRLEDEKEKLQERIKELEWMLTEHD